MPDRPRQRGWGWLNDGCGHLYTRAQRTACDGGRRQRRHASKQTTRALTASQRASVPVSPLLVRPSSALLKSQSTLCLGGGGCYCRDRPSSACSLEESFFEEHILCVLHVRPVLLHCHDCRNNTPFRSDQQSKTYILVWMHTVPFGPPKRVFFAGSQKRFVTLC